jgi:hypothetical protein
LHLFSSEESEKSPFLFVFVLEASRAVLLFHWVDEAGRLVVAEILQCGDVHGYHHSVKTISGELGVKRMVVN